ncbi:hypothetical protein Syun_001657 [Stephania yunnanensis]|uniref:Uncharacterized protein n=1 Tax=Stephania yunnanensis TaxID=152371 RepID=A0AAP0LG43_9MAGN
MTMEEALRLLLVYSAVVVDNAEVESTDDGVGLGAEEVVAIDLVDEDAEGKVNDEDEEDLVDNGGGCELGLGDGGVAVVDAMTGTFAAQVTLCKVRSCLSKGVDTVGGGVVSSVDPSSLELIRGSILAVEGCRESTEAFEKAVEVVVMADLVEFSAAKARENEVAEVLNLVRWGRVVVAEARN